MFRLFIILGLVLLITAPALAESEDRLTGDKILGFGNMMCREVTAAGSGEKISVPFIMNSISWVQGFLSGANVASGKIFKVAFTTKDISDFVRVGCLANPDKKLSLVTAELVSFIYKNGHAVEDK